MSKSLLIVESPTKARTLGKYLGKDFIVKASVGHVKDLPKNKLGIDLKRDFEPEYQVIRGKKKIINELTEAAERADAVYLGPDPDREGEAIAWHIAQEIQVGDKPVHRVLFYELTQKAIQKALAEPGSLNRSRYEAQQARRILDRLVGYLISPILWQKVQRGLSAGRVQSVALRLISDREKEIRKFSPEEFWTVDARLTQVPDGGPGGAAKSFAARLARCGRKTCKITDAEEAHRVVEALKPMSYAVSKVVRKKKRRNPSPPFITSSLQQDAARKLRFSARQTMSVAQRLYEGVELGKEGAVGLITYMRTDSTRLSQEAVQAARDYILRKCGKEYLPSKPAIYKKKEGAQDAHEAIRPTDVEWTPEKVAQHLTKEQLKLYSLIWKRFVASQMTPAILDVTSVDIAAGDYTLHAAGSVIEFPGFMKLYVEGRDEDEADDEKEGLLPDLKEGQQLTLSDIEAERHFTQPPPRFSEASLIKELEEQGIGRPSTYATILSTILDRGYVSLQKQRLYPSELGLLINDLMVDNFPSIVDVEFTARLEKSLDEVEGGGQPYNELLSGFYGQFSKTLESAQNNMLNLKAVGVPTELSCPRCGSPLNIRWSRNGPFLACADYPDCRFSSDYVRDDDGKVRLAEEQPTGETCEKCGRPMLLKKGRFGVFLACSGYPECKNTRSPGTGISCPQDECDGELVERVSRTGRHFYGCNRYPKCKVAFWGKPVRTPCPSCGAKILIEKESKRWGVRRTCANPSCRYAEQVSKDTGREAERG